MSPLFQAVTEATEEAVINSLFASGTMKGHQGSVDGLPVDDVLSIVRRTPQPPATGRDTRK